MALLLLGCTLLGEAGATVLRVPADQPSIADALAAAGAGDSVLVACGLYEESGLQLVASVTLLSEGGADCATIDALDASAVLGANGIVDAVVQGFTLQSGNNIFSFGGGVSCTNSTLTLRDVHMTDNLAAGGGGFFASGSQLTVIGCEIRANRAAEDSGFRLSGGHADFVDCVIADNDPAIGGGGGLFAASASFVRCSFENNESHESGGGLEIWTGSQASFVECSFVGNQALWGGALYFHQDTPLSTFLDCEIRGNTATSDGGGLYVGGGCVVEVEGGVIRDNLGPSGPAGIVQANGSALLRCVDTDPAEWVNLGTLQFEFDECPVPLRRMSFGELRERFQRP